MTEKRQAGLGFGFDRAVDGKDEWLTPPRIIHACGAFDLDPCAPIKSKRFIDTAAKHYTIEDDGLQQKWEGRVWLNPPYGTQTETWVRRLVEHGNGVCLIFARTETGTFFPWVWGHAHGILFLRGRLIFWELHT